ASVRRGCLLDGHHRTSAKSLSKMDQIEHGETLPRPGISHMLSLKRCPGAPVAALKRGRN
ncbi:MAG: hypothetical protein J0626_02170, partial [Rhodospirillaceae bacterium]|nr:hypothetical protein [Rhodospirillaceae bacterium]